MGSPWVQWVARRRLKSRVEPDGSLNGTTIYRLGNVRMVFSHERHRFNRVVVCSSCGRLRATRRPVTASDLHWGGYYDLCSACVPATVQPMDLADVEQVLSQEEDNGRSGRPLEPPTSPFA